MSGTLRHELRFPRWLEVSGLPEHLHQSTGPSGWAVFRRMIEHEVECNLIPGSCTIDLECLSRYTGIPLQELAVVLDDLQKESVLTVLDTFPPNIRYEIPVPLPVPLSEREIRSRLVECGIDASRVYLRYAQPVEHQDRYKRVIQLYQALYGLQYTPKTAETLERIALECGIGEILQAFSEAFQNGGKSLSWIKKRLGVS